MWYVSANNEITEDLFEYIAINKLKENVQVTPNQTS